MGKLLRVLIVEDSELDAALVLRELSTAYDVVAERVQTAGEMQAALDRTTWDIVLSDFTLPSFSAPAALQVLQASKKLTPFIIVSGTIGEETAVAALKAGASDFLVKGKLARLIPAVERELRDAKTRRERVALEERLRQSEKLEAIGRLAGGIAHDFNNILTAILGYSEMILEQIGPDKPISRDLDEIRKASIRAAALTRQLLAFSRKQALHVTALDVNQIVLDMRDMLQRLIRDNIEMHLDLAERLPIIVGDRAQLEQVVMNLVTNAGDAMPNGGRLTVATATTADESAADGVPKQVVTLRVSDTGSGMDADTQAQIFEPFFTTKAAGKGTGLGLPTVYGVVQQLGGQITLSSAVGTGTTFILEFPAASDAFTNVAHVPNDEPRAAPELGRETVLVVDDEHGVRTIVSRVLQRHGYRVLEAASAADAIVIAQKHDDPIHLVVSDVVMPTMSGPDMVVLLKKLRGRLKVLYMSGYPDETSSQHSVSDMAMLDKPFSASELLRAVRGVLTG